MGWYWISAKIFEWLNLHQTVHLQIRAAKRRQLRPGVRSIPTTAREGLPVQVILIFLIFTKIHVIVIFIIITYTVGQTPALILAQRHEKVFSPSALNPSCSSFFSSNSSSSGGDGDLPRSRRGAGLGPHKGGQNHSQGEYFQNYDTADCIAEHKTLCTQYKPKHYIWQDKNY